MPYGVDALGNYKYVAVIMAMRCEQVRTVFQYHLNGRGLGIVSIAPPGNV